MELFIVAVVVGFAIWFVASGAYRTNIRDPQTLRPAELEDSILELKKEILVTNAYTEEAKYLRLYRRLVLLMGAVLDRHQHFVLDADAKGLPQAGFFQRKEHYDSDGLISTSYAVSRGCQFRSVDPEALIFACFFLWHGGQVKGIGEIEEDPKLMLAILDDLIAEKNYAPALFMKGMVRKYGLRIYSECFPAEARQLFEAAKRAGVGSAAVELQYLDKFSQLAGVKSVQLGEPH